MSWSLNAKGALDEIEALIEQAQESPAQETDAGKAQVAAGKDAATSLAGALAAAEGNVVSASVSGHVGEGNTGYSSLSVSVYEQPPERTQTV